MDWIKIHSKRSDNWVAIEYLRKVSEVSWSGYAFERDGISNCNNSWFGYELNRIAHVLKCTRIGFRDLKNALRNDWNVSSIDPARSNARRKSEGWKSWILSVKLNSLALAKLFSEGFHELQRLRNRVVFSPVIEKQNLWCISDSENGSSVQLLQNHRNSLALHRLKGSYFFVGFTGYRWCKR